MNRIKTQLSFIAILAFSSSAFAQGEVLRDAFNNTMVWAFAIAVFFLLVALAALNKALNTIKLMSMQKAGVSVKEVAAKTEEQGSLIKSLTDAVPIEKEADILLDHDYDGIKELDNNLPPWWLYGFYLTIVYAVVYLILFHVTGTAPLSDEEFDNEMAQAKEEVNEYLAKMGDMVDENNVTFLTDASSLEAGKNLFTANCVACHLADGGGSIGPNLTDEYWINGDGSVVEIFKVIKYGGRPAKGMIPWKDQMSPKQMQQVTSYVMTLKGTTPASPKAPEGEKYEASQIEEAIDEPADSTAEVSSVSKAEFDQELAYAGADVFRKQCAVCHTKDGGGLVGPNLTDNFWIKGDGTYESIVETINVGSPEKGMVAWKGVLPDEEIDAVTNFILSLRGTNPDNPKEAEGTEYVL